MNKNTDLQKQADDLAKEAKVLLNSIFCQILKLDQKTGLQGVDRLVDCIIGSAILTVASVMEAGEKKKQD